ncbi:MAG: Hsp20/alpha crystallin family protein [Anaerolineales bacterium]|nr:Hsp20/alpha crystallin family protein [Anaerolineales bacterium]
MMYRRYRVSPIWREMDRLQQEMSRLYEEFRPPRWRVAPAYPALNVWSSDDALLVTAELPGVSSEDIEVSVVGETLTLNGVRKPDELKEGARYHRQERGYGKFSRTLQLPFPVKVEGIEASFKNGVLQIHMPRAEEDRPRKIAVKTA